MEFRRSRTQDVGRSKKKQSPSICKKHPKHRQSPGVCAMCLREKLSQLSKSSRKYNMARHKNVYSSACSSSSLSSLSISEYSSSNASSCLSPVHRRSSSLSSSSMAFLRSGKNVFMKSKSMAFVMQRHQGEASDHGKKKKRGFWSKLLRQGAKKEVMHDNGLMLS